LRVKFGAAITIADPGHYRPVPLSLNVTLKAYVKALISLNRIKALTLRANTELVLVSARARSVLWVRSDFLVGFESFYSTFSRHLEAAEHRDINLLDV
jgi:hypothetical protein